MPKSILLKAKFRGDQIAGSFKKGLNYNLEFQIQEFNKDLNHIHAPVQIRTTTKPTLIEAYPSIHGFFDNWTDIKPR